MSQMMREISNEKDLAAMLAEVQHRCRERTLDAREVWAVVQRERKKALPVGGVTVWGGRVYKAYRWRATASRATIMWVGERMFAHVDRAGISWTTPRWQIVSCEEVFRALPDVSRPYRERLDRSLRQEIAQMGAIAPPESDLLVEIWRKWKSGTIIARSLEQWWLCNPYGAWRITARPVSLEHAGTGTCPEDVLKDLPAVLAALGDPGTGRWASSALVAAARSQQAPELWAHLPTDPQKLTLLARRHILATLIVLAAESQDGKAWTERAGYQELARLLRKYPENNLHYLQALSVLPDRTALEDMLRVYRSLRSGYDIYLASLAMVRNHPCPDVLGAIMNRASALFENQLADVLYRAGESPSGFNSLVRAHIQYPALREITRRTIDAILTWKSSDIVSDLEEENVLGLIAVGDMDLLKKIATRAADLPSPPAWLPLAITWQ